MAVSDNVLIFTFLPFLCIDVGFSNSAASEDVYIFESSLLAVMSISSILMQKEIVFFPAESHEEFKTERSA